MVSLRDAALTVSALGRALKPPGIATARRVVSGRQRAFDVGARWRLVLRAARAVGGSRDCRDHAEGCNCPYAITAPQFPTPLLQLGRLRGLNGRRGGGCLGSE